MSQLTPTDHKPRDAAQSPGRPVLEPTPRGRILRSISLLPALFTLMNGLFGFAAIHYATKAAPPPGAQFDNMTFACWMLLAAMVCDMLDGRLARMTRRTTDFGAQLDSLCDVISFGVAPAVMIYRTFSATFGDPLIPERLILERIVICAAGLYVACAVVRLARFNVESEEDEAAHITFAGLPTPGAAAVIVAMVMLRQHLSHAHVERELIPCEPAMSLIVGALPIVAVLTSLLMVSRIVYPHLINQYFRGKRSFGYLVRLLVIVVAAFVEPYITFAAIALIYVVSGPIRWVWLRARRPKERPVEL